VERLLRRMPAVRVAQAARRLHAICAEAQGLAADLAVAAAEGRDMPLEDRRQCAARLHGEALRETALRLCLDWPQLTGEPPHTGAARELIAMLHADQPAEPAALRRWLAAMLSTFWPERLLAAAPENLRPIFAARLEDMEDRLRRIEAREPVACGLSPEPGLGEATVPTARGADASGAHCHGVVSEYRIEAPTARRFAAGGEAETLLARCGDADAGALGHARDRPMRGLGGGDGLMHEMAICESIREIVQDQARAAGFARVERVRLAIGALSGVEVEAALRLRCGDARQRGRRRPAGNRGSGGHGMVYALRRQRKHRGAL
jgi:hypothetical protein